MKTIFISSIILLSFVQGYAQREVFIKSNAAIQGYDPVAYFKIAMPVKGRPEYTYKWKDATWYFSSQENLHEFKATRKALHPNSEDTVHTEWLKVTKLRLHPMHGPY